MTPKVINVFTDSELQLIKIAIEHLMRTISLSQSDKNTYTNILSIIDRILTRKESETC